ncbi:papain fold toxin domain-containing protein [Tamlana sp. 2201CG12-4]|uniref:papain fold toxin domain-containing protein n=1 Tax=Tamlana sp. 2201CG12-4 TaxID=3112582 RepID=UPI002DBE3AD1|nr:papain fold toxin domain-containing protein [Tamlana sp. 2201CG12-4]MEC3906135.1 papain fold toxin domain-containing protein [Tamlana sp. 2201CG12-4]
MDVLTYNDYYSFGQLLPNRHGSSDSYRYGFQGQEKDDEIKGEGNSLNYKFRMHDPRVGRFFAVDPLERDYPYYSPYVFSGNKVIQFKELEGLEPDDYDLQYDPFAGIRLLNTIMDGLEVASYNTYTWIQTYGTGTQPNSTNSRTVKTLEQGDDGFYRVRKGDVKRSFKDGSLGLLDVLGLSATFYGGPSGLLTKPTGGGTQFSQTIKGLIQNSKAIVGTNVYGKCTQYAEGFVKTFQKSVSEVGGKIKRYSIEIGDGGFIGTSRKTTNKQLSDNGYHEFIEISKDGKSIIYDNLHPDGINKVDYFKDVEGFLPGKGVVPSEDLFKEGGEFLKVIEETN